jgi:(p)ppGpp synthase/HD superfamily hydrolase
MVAPTTLESVLVPLQGPEFERTRLNLRSLWVEAESLPSLERALVASAMEWCVSCHLRQRPRPNGVPYLEHVTSVAARVSTWSEHSATLVVAALLHDAVEDQAPALAERCPDSDASVEERAFQAVRWRFGDRVEALLQQLTNPDFARLLESEHGLAHGTPAFNAGKCALYALHFVALFHDDEDAALIKLADFCDNALEVGVLEQSSPDTYRWLVRKYGPCVDFLWDFLNVQTSNRSMGRAAEDVLPELDLARREHYGRRG